MKHLFAIMCRALCAWLLLAGSVQAAGTTNPEVVRAMLNRIGGDGAADLFVTEVDPSLATDGRDVFVITSSDGKPCIKGNTVLSVTTGIGWYLNHNAGINLAWNNLSANLAAATLPVPTGEEKHECTADYRYYFNYCTYSYSMAFWTWERWQQEVDWMALHGVNMPLALVGADVVWKNVLAELGYSKDETNRFIAGPGFQAWWLMNNLEGWGGPNPDWWYVRQEKLAKNILKAMRDFGMEPILPGYSGMVPHNIAGKTGWNVADPGKWISFQRPGFLLPTDEHFAEMATLYYKHLEALMGTSAYYSMDPFHEGGNTDKVDLPAAYQAIYDEMSKVNPEAKWVIQSWNENPRSECLTTIKHGKLIVLDLFSDGTPKWQGGYNGHEMVYCMLHNFGGRVGLHGRLERTMSGYYDALAQFPNTMKGVGATPEGIETNPMLYDALFELPWRAETSAEDWINGYATARYGVENDDAKAAWQSLRRSVYDCTTSQQGTSEPIICARPALYVEGVSTWSKSIIYYDPQDVIRAAALMLKGKDALQRSPNYGYDLADMTRQAITDYAQKLLATVKQAHDSGDGTAFKQQYGKFLQLILDQDRLLATNENFRLGRWTQMARGVTDEADGTGTTDKDWMEWQARTQITVWADQESGLHDYSNREWSGLLKDFHYERWAKYFNHLDTGASLPNWYEMENAWTRDMTLTYAAEPDENTADVAAELFDKYFGSFTTADTVYYFPRNVQTVVSDIADMAVRGSVYTFNSGVAANEVASLGIDLNGNGTIDAGEKSTSLQLNVPAEAKQGRHKAELCLNDGTSFVFRVVVRDVVTEARTVTVASADESQGTVEIDGATGGSITTKDDVVMRAKPKSGYDFLKWTYGDGLDVEENTNPYYYFGTSDEHFTAHFVESKWGVVKENYDDVNDIKTHEQYVSVFSYNMPDETPEVFYTAKAYPGVLFNIIPSMINVERGKAFTVSWDDTEKNGLSYCRLSAYIDLNADGDFTDAGEFLEVRGDKKGNNNSTVSSGSLTVNLPATAALGITHMRLRFDSSWLESWDSNDAVAPTADTKRMVYDIPVNITEKYTIKVVSADPEVGTVAISGLDNPATVNPGERIILQAQSKTGFMLDYWADELGNKVSSAANYAFEPTADGTYTAHFKREPISEDKYYTITFERNTRRLGSFEAVGDKEGYISDADAPRQIVTGSAITVSADLNSLVQFVKVSGEDSYFIKMVNASASNKNRIFYLGSIMDGNNGAVNLAMTDVYDEGNNTLNAQWAGKYQIGDGSNKSNNVLVCVGKKDGYDNQLYLNSLYNEGHNTDTHIIGYKDGNADGGNLVTIAEVKSVNLSIGNTKWASVCYPFAVVLPEGVTAYNGATVNSESITLEEIGTGGTIVAAGTPMFVLATEPGVYGMTLTSEAGTSPANSLLSGATVRREGFAGGEIYGLAATDDGLNAELRKNAATVTAVPANKAYMAASLIPAGAEKLSFDFGTSTGIGNVISGKGDVEYYDLNGRRVMYPVSGVYVTNTGRKVYVK